MRRRRRRLAALGQCRTLSTRRRTAAPGHPLVGRSAYFLAERPQSRAKCWTPPVICRTLALDQGAGGVHLAGARRDPHAHPIGSTRRAAAVTRFVPTAVIGAVVLVAASIVGMPSAS